jgi:isochorismate hydrolase
MSYMNSSKNGLLNKDDSILVLIDMQERLIPVISEKEKVLENVVKLIRFSHIIGIPVVLTEQQKLGPTHPEIRKELMGVRPIPKIEFDCFGSNAFREHIEQINRNSLIIAGIEAHICVAQTAVHAVSDYTAHVVSDAIASRSPKNVTVALQRMQQCGVTITSTEMVMYELMGKAGTDTFREVLHLVK